MNPKGLLLCDQEPVVNRIEGFGKVEIDDIDIFAPIQQPGHLFFRFEKICETRPFVTA